MWISHKQECFVSRGIASTTPAKLTIQLLILPNPCLSYQPSWPSPWPRTMAPPTIYLLVSHERIVCKDSWTNCTVLHESNILPWLIRFCITVFNCPRVSKYLKLKLGTLSWECWNFHALSLSSQHPSVWWCHFRLLWCHGIVCKHLQLVRKLICFKHNNILCVTHVHVGSWLFIEGRRTMVTQDMHKQVYSSVVAIVQTLVWAHTIICQMVYSTSFVRGVLQTESTSFGRGVLQTESTSFGHGVLQTESTLFGGAGSPCTCTRTVVCRVRMWS